MTILFVLNIWACACSYLVLVHRKLLRHCGDTTSLETFLDPADTSGGYERVRHFQWRLSTRTHSVWGLGGRENASSLGTTS